VQVLALSAFLTSFQRTCEQKFVFPDTDIIQPLPMLEEHIRHEFDLGRKSITWGQLSTTNDRKTKAMQYTVYCSPLLEE